jgi:hypothetical protein
MIVFDQNILENIRLVDQVDVQSCENFNFNLREYTKFIDIRLQDIEQLRFIIFEKQLLIEPWCDKILRFSEINAKNIRNKLNPNISNRDDIENVIKELTSLLLESSYYSGDLRFLNVALKFLKSYDYSIEFKKDSNSYNALLAQFLLQKI